MKKKRNIWRIMINNTMVTDEEFEHAKSVIKVYEDQINKERQELFRKSLEKYDHTYWKYVRPMESIYMCAALVDDRLKVVRFIERSNGILEVKSESFDNERMENYLRTLSEFEHNSMFNDDEKYIFEKIGREEFINCVNYILHNVPVSKILRLGIINE